MDFTFYLSLGTAIVVAAVGVLKVVAPKTKTMTDDTILARLEALEKLLKSNPSTVK